MRVLVATAETQGLRQDDYFWATEGELVYEAPACDCPDCGCWWGMAGLESQRPTSTFKVIDSTLDESLYAEKVRAGLDRAGWLTGCSATEASAAARDHAAKLLKIAASYPAGTVLERRGNRVRQRQPTSRR